MPVLLAPPLTLGPASLTFPELAQALTKAGMPTVAAPDLGDRAAFVRLKGRDPERVRAILAETLGVDFRKQGDGWRMVADPAAVERDRLFLGLYRRQAVEAAAAWAAAEEAMRGGRTYAALDRDVRGASKAFETLPDAAPDAATKAKLRRLFALSVLLNPSAWLGLTAFQDADRVGAALSGPVAWTPDLGLPASALGGPAPSLRATLAYDPLTGLLQAEVRRPDGAPIPDYPFAAKVGPYAVRGTGGSAEARVEGVTLVETFNRMGQAAGEYLRSLGPPAPLPATPAAKGAVPPTLSSLLERLDVEAAMELSPRFEGLPLRQMPPNPSLRDALAVQPYPVAPDPTGAPAWLLDLSRLEDRTSVVARARSFPWRVRDREGVLEFVNPVAFLDRAQWVSPAPALRVERLLAALPPDAPTDLSGMPLPDWSRLEAISAALAQGEGLYGDYRGVRLGPYAPLLPFVRLVAAVPDRATLWRDAARAEGARVAVDGGTLEIQASLWSAEYGYKRSVVHVTARWTGSKGEALYGEGTLDPKGTP